MESCDNMYKHTLCPFFLNSDMLVQFMFSLLIFCPLMALCLQHGGRLPAPCTLALDFPMCCLPYATPGYESQGLETNTVAFVEIRY